MKKVPAGTAVSSQFNPNSRPVLKSTRPGTDANDLATVAIEDDVAATATAAASDPSVRLYKARQAISNAYYVHEILIPAIVVFSI